MGDRKTVVLAYRRAEGELSTGEFYLQHGEDRTPLTSFERAPYVDMMKTFARHLSAHPEAAGAIQRTDRPGLVRIALEADEVELFRRDPVAAIHQRMIPPQVVHIGVDKGVGPDRTAVATVNARGQVLDAGYASLVECFGDVVYARFRRYEQVMRVRPQVECPLCGTWAALDGSLPAGPVCHCAECRTIVPVADLAAVAAFVGFRVTDLLATGSDRFFLPRRWNNHRNWITRVDLEELYAKYNKEKAS